MHASTLWGGILVPRPLEMPEDLKRLSDLPAADLVEGRLAPRHPCKWRVA